MLFYINKNIYTIGLTILILLFSCNYSKKDKSKIKNNNSNLKLEKEAKSNNYDPDIMEYSLEISKKVYLDINLGKYSEMINIMVNDIKKEIKGNDTPKNIIGIINEYLYKKIGFKYDFKDMEAKETKNQFITSYLDNKVGSCITMPLLYLIISQKLNLPIYWVKAPEHFFCRYILEDGTYIDIEATSGGKIADDSKYIRDFHITEKEIQKGIYMKTLTNNECASDLLCILAAYYARNGEKDKAISNFIKSLKLNPVNPFAYKFLGMLYKDKDDELKSQEYFKKAKNLGLEFNN